jgi:hypothetical protein
MPRIDDTDRRYASLLLRYHRLLGGQETSDEAIQVEDEMTALWQQLDPVQRKSLSGLASDLSWVRPVGRLAPKPEDVSLEDCDTLDEARRIGDWHELLHQIRVCASSIPWSDSARLRAEAWSSLGQADLAGVFWEFSRLSSDVSSSSEPKPRG